MTRMQDLERELEQARTETRRARSVRFDLPPPPPPSERSSSIHNQTRPGPPPTQNQGYSQFHSMTEPYHRPYRVEGRELSQPLSMISNERPPGDPIPRDPALDREHSSSSAAATRPPRMADPFKFSGDDKSKFDCWLNMMLIKLQAERSYYDNEPNFAIRYVISRLEGPALRSVTPRMPGYSTSAFRNVREVIDHLTPQYGDHSRSDKAREEYEKLRKSPSEPFDRFFTKFRTCIFYMDKSERDKIEDL